MIQSVSCRLHKNFAYTPVQYIFHDSSFVLLLQIGLYISYMIRIPRSKEAVVLRVFYGASGKAFRLCPPRAHPPYLPARPSTAAT